MGSQAGSNYETGCNKDSGLEPPVVIDLPQVIIEMAKQVDQY